MYTYIKQCVKIRRFWYGRFDRNPSVICFVLTTSSILLTHGVISQFTISSHFRDSTKLDQKGRGWWRRVTRTSPAGRNGGKGHPTRQHFRKTNSPALLTHGVISQFTISSHFRDSTELDQKEEEWWGGLREPALLGEVGERGKIKSTAASSW